jgi:hypothetical protein
VRSGVSPKAQRAPIGFNFSQEVRCDSKYPEDTTRCVIWRYTPTLEMNVKRYPAATPYAIDRSDGWHIYSDERFGVPLWTEVCGRASMPGQQNQNAGSSLSGFVGALRLQDNDPFSIDIPELAGCDPDDHRTIS